MLTGKELAKVSQEQGEKTKELLGKVKENLSRGLSVGNEVFAAEAKGAVIQDLDGNTYIDFFAGVGVLNAGHRPEPVVEAIKDQADKYLHTFFHQVMHGPYVEFSEKLLDLVPINGPKKAALFNSGAEAVENAVKTARFYTKRQAVICFESAFHGRTLLTMTLTSKVKPYKYGFGPFAPEIYKVPSAYCYRCPWNSAYPGCGMHCLEQFHHFFKAEVDAADVAAMIIEPVQGEGGFIVPPKEFLPGLKNICQENGIVFIADEIQTGFCRTGKMFAVENYGVEPDLITCAKSMAAGMPVSAVVGKAEIMDAPDPGQLGGTYCGNPVACAAGIATLDYLKAANLNDRASAISKYTLGRLGAMQEKYPEIGDVRALGAMIALEFVKDRGTKEPDKDAVGKIVKECFKRGLIIISAGVLGNVIRMLMPLVITDEQLTQALDILEESCAVVLKK
ncbi:4-aminobutyrate--2-oxoglutarate transaminase [Candidatus Formimonas warabiya]|uniref:4-aminobutyrate aminotransferase n=1 Tax=Formimonas warabiya TaxID=1761012 RepID=A0A3G1KYG5_FORW1|nr:4-aminobutyrate--2-oxoglutarate transaminase [Candidatus Formimonas warabiya]ATW27255.1 4-aminobutyrate transaminase [Candidatus Formimonas warabiya]